MKGAAAILITSPSNQALPGALAVDALPDLHLMAAGQTTRALPAVRRR